MIFSLFSFDVNRELMTKNQKILNEYISKFEKFYKQRYFKTIFLLIDLINNTTCNLNIDIKSATGSIV
jgi:hypothetical protein